MLFSLVKTPCRHKHWTSGLHLMTVTKCEDIHAVSFGYTGNTYPSKMPLKSMTINLNFSQQMSMDVIDMPFLWIIHGNHVRKKEKYSLSEIVFYQTPINLGLTGWMEHELLTFSCVYHYPSSSWPPSFSALLQAPLSWDNVYIPQSQTPKHMWDR